MLGPWARYLAQIDLAASFSVSTSEKPCLWIGKRAVVAIEQIAGRRLQIDEAATEDATFIPIYEQAAVFPAKKNVSGLMFTTTGGPLFYNVSLA